MSQTGPAPVPTSAKRELLLETAWALFCQNGYRAIGIDTVLAKAGVAKMTLYNHFASKEDLIAAAMAKKGAEILAMVDGVIAAAGKNPERRLLAVFDWLAVWFESKDFTGCAFIKAVGEYTAAGDKPRQAAAAYKQALQDRLQALAAEAGLKSPALLARQLMFLIDGATLHADMKANAAFAAEARAAAKSLIEAAKP
jgi:AcrR family transcriptional regulator